MPPADRVGDVVQLEVEKEAHTGRPHRRREGIANAGRAVRQEELQPELDAADGRLRPSGNALDELGGLGEIGGVDAAVDGIGAGLHGGRNLTATPRPSNQELPRPCAPRILPAGIAAIARRRSLRPGLNARSSTQVLDRASSEGHRPAFEARQEGRAQGRGLGHLRPLDGRAPTVSASRCISGSFTTMPPSTRSFVDLRAVAAHRLDQVAGLVADRIERGGGDLAGARIARQAQHRARALRHPSRARPGPRRPAPCRRRGRPWRGPRPVSTSDDFSIRLQPVAQPLHGGAGDEDAALQRIGPPAVELIGDGGEQARWRELHGDAAGVQQREAARAVGRLDHAGLDAGLAHGRGLLVAGHAQDRHRRTENIGGGDTQLARAIDDLEATATPARRRSFISSGSQAPLRMSSSSDAAGVGGVARMHLAAGQAPQQEAFDGAGRERALLGRSAGAGDMIRGSTRSWCRRNRDRAAGRCDR